MDKLFALLSLLIGIGVLAVVLLFPVQWLWNTTLPDLFDFPKITAWQALKINLLFGLLFGRLIHTE